MQAPGGRRDFPEQWQRESSSLPSKAPRLWAGLFVGFTQITRFVSSPIEAWKTVGSVTLLAWTEVANGEGSDLRG